MKLFHVSKKNLKRWLDGEENPKIEKHLNSCERCFNIIENMDSDLPEVGLNEALAEALAPNDEFVDQLEGRVSKRLESREVLSVMSGIFASGIETTRILVTEESNDIS